MYPQLYKEYMTITDLVAIGTVSDLMPMTDENLIFVRNGIKQLEEASRLSLRPFLIHQKLFGKSLTSSDIGWQIAPQMNASGRMGRPDVAVNMLLCTDEKSTEELALELFRMNKERQEEGEKCWDRILPSARDMYEKLGSKLVLVDDERIPRGIAGILATRLQKTFKAPSVVITKTDENRCIGSMRSPKTFNCHDFLATFSDLFIDFGGHAFAGGFSILPENKDELCNRIAEQIDWMDFPDDVEDELEIDAALTQTEMTLDLVQRIKRFEPYGEQNEAPAFLAEGAVIEDLTRMSNSHIRFVMSYGTYKWPCVFWSAGDRVENNEFSNGSKADIVFRIGMNSFRGQETVQLTVLDLKVR
jgi:single-stranded-DNA-specific exonuclease